MQDNFYSDVWNAARAYNAFVMGASGAEAAGGGGGSGSGSGGSKSGGGGGGAVAPPGANERVPSGGAGGRAVKPVFNAYGERADRVIEDSGAAGRRRRLSEAPQLEAARSAAQPELQATQGRALRQAPAPAPPKQGRPMIVGPSWHNLGITAPSLQALARTGACYLKEVRFLFDRDLSLCLTEICCVLWLCFQRGHPAHHTTKHNHHNHHTIQTLHHPPHRPNTRHHHPTHTPTTQHAHN